ncbi:UNVERIFIED_CONTAM: hypothetical protein HDU68_003312 [Siphonaria sp. JEL0065]|nr:hypothetical protein HDU68_003312 [Siphonaria sp. JEL0065]
MFNAILSALLLFQQVQCTVRYNGGTVFTHMVVQPIFWGQIGTQIPATRPQLDLLYSELVKSSYVQLNEYGVQSVTYNESIFVITNSQPVYDDSEDIQFFLRGLVSDGTITPTANTYYPLYLYTGSLSFGNLNTCVDFCYYRNSFDISDLNIPGVSRLYYGVFPQLMFKCDSCQTISLIANLFLDSAAALINAATNPSATNPNSPNGFAAGYVDSQTGVSVGDYCTKVKGVHKLEEVVTDGGKHFQLPPVWSQSLGGCTVDFQNIVEPVGNIVGV